MFKTNTNIIGCCLSILVIFITIADYLISTKNNEHSHKRNSSKENNDFKESSSQTSMSSDSCFNLFHTSENDSTSSSVFENAEPYSDDKLSSENEINENEQDFRSKMYYIKSYIRNKDYFTEDIIRLIIDRNNIVFDSINELENFTIDELKTKKIRIYFLNEEGYDFTGLSTEWINLFFKEILDPKFGLFDYVSNNNYTLRPSYDTNIVPEKILHYKYIGRLIALSIIKKINIGLNFNRTIYNYILKKDCELSDFKYFSMSVYNSLIIIKDNFIDDLDLTFAYNLTDVNGTDQCIELKPGGSDIYVDHQNKEEYLHLFTKNRIYNCVELQLQAIRDGIYEILDIDLLNVFNPEELELFICGKQEIDIEDWKKHTCYIDYDKEDFVIESFWKILSEFSSDEKTKLLQFCTGSLRVPFGGFKELQGNGGKQWFTIAKFYDDDSKGRLPFALTCFNRLVLSYNQNYENMKKNYR